MFEFDAAATPSREQVLKTATALVEGEPDIIANMANVASLLWYSIPDINWVGFYRMVNGELVLGPFHGKPACIRIALGKGVCGTAAAEKRTCVVENVHEFPGHIACDSASNSEVVVPVMDNDEVIAVFDIDSPSLGRFTPDDVTLFEAIVQVLLHPTTA